MDTQSPLTSWTTFFGGGSWFAVLSESYFTIGLLGLLVVLYLLENRLASTGRKLTIGYPLLGLSNTIKRLFSGLTAKDTSKDCSRRTSRNSIKLIYNLPDAPTPLRLPVIGHLYLLAKYPTNPWEGFNAITKQYGNVVRLQLGKYRTVMVSSTEAIREVLLIKGDAFADRPHFDRHAIIFGENRQNALALCDWSDIHKTRRSIAHAAVIPRFGTITFERLSNCIQTSVSNLLIEINQTLSLNGTGSAIMEKDRLMRMCGAIFVEFLLEKKVKVNSPSFQDVCKRYDFIFYDINQMYLCDFLPFLKVTAKSYLKNVAGNSAVLMKYINEEVIGRFEHLLEKRKAKQKEKANSQSTNPELEAQYDEKSCDERFVDRILLHKQYQSSAQFLDFILNHYIENQHVMNWDEVLYEIADLVGGNSAVGNLMARLLGHLALNPGVQQQLYEEAMSVLTRDTQPGKAAITLKDQPHMPLTNASIMETLRLASSPIVPHLARYDTSIQGYFVPKDTMVLFNVYHLNMSNELWEEPTKFNPSRFVTPEGNVMKPDFFFPFSHGRRSCLGYKMVNTTIFSTVSNLLVHYRLESGTRANAAKMNDLLQPRGSIALPHDGACFNFTLVPRR